MDITTRASRIKLLLMDCDGVLTDGRLHFDASGEAFKSFFVRDGQGLVYFHAAGLESGIISGRSSPIVETRAAQLGVKHVYQGVTAKGDVCLKLMADRGYGRDQVAWIGDDTPDLEVFPHVGLAVAVADAHPHVRAAADYVTLNPGGKGAVREVIDLILSSRQN